MYNRIIVPIDGSKPADKALDHTIRLARSISVDGRLNKIEIIILSIIPDLPATLGFEPPRRSIKTGEVISFSEYVNEMYELKRLNAIKLVSARKKEYESHRTKDDDFTLREEVIVGKGNSISDTILEFANKETSRFVSDRQYGVKWDIKAQNIRKCI